jgi:hypothetical protein
MRECPAGCFSGGQASGGSKISLTRENGAQNI